MTTSQASTKDRPDITVIAAHNDAFRKFACLGTPPGIAIPGRMHVTRSLMEAEDGFMSEAVKTTGEFDTFEPENDPDSCHDFGAVDIQGQKVFWKIDLFLKRTAISGLALRPLTILQPPCACSTS